MTASRVELSLDTARSLGLAARAAVKALRGLAEAFRRIVRALERWAAALEESRPVMAGRCPTCDAPWMYVRQENDYDTFWCGGAAKTITTATDIFVECADGHEHRVLAFTVDDRGRANFELAEEGPR